MGGGRAAGVELQRQQISSVAVLQHTLGCSECACVFVSSCVCVYVCVFV